MAKLFGGGDLFDQAKFVLGLGTFIYAVWSIWGNRVGVGEPPYPLPEGILGGLMPGAGDPMVRSTPNCNEASNMCACPNGDVFQMGASRTCADCSTECAKRGGAGEMSPPAESAESMVAWYYGRPVRDHGLGWTLSDFGDNDPKNRLTVA